MKIDVSQFDPWAKITPAAFAELIFVQPSSITRACGTGAVKIEDDGLIIPAKNYKYIYRKFSRRVTKHSPAQRLQGRQIIDALLKNEKINNPVRYDYLKMKNECNYELGFFQDSGEWLAIANYNKDDDDKSSELHTYVPGLVLEIRKNRIERVFLYDYDEDFQIDLHMVEAD